MKYNVELEINQVYKKISVEAFTKIEAAMEAVRIAQSGEIPKRPPPPFPPCDVGISIISVAEAGG